MTIRTPDWVKHTVFYQIFPDRFCRSERTPHPPGLKFKPWGSPPAEQGYQGGDLYGILEKLDYLQDLGVTAIYLNPVFSSASNHRYHTYDYFQVDPLLGGNAALRALLDEMHRRGMRLVLDGVFNHASRGFWQFHHVLENGGNSPYADWFTIRAYPLNPYDPTGTSPANYAAWNDLPALPKLNTDHPAVREFIYGVAEHWLRFGIDGWRLDVPEEIRTEGFWEEFRERVKAIREDAYLVGEIWESAPDWLQGSRFDALMNYPLSGASLGFFGARSLAQDYHKAEFSLIPLNAQRFSQRIDSILTAYPQEVNQVQLNLLDSHDTPRALWMLGEDTSALRLCVLFQMCMPGAPCIYYGDEIGMSGGDDPDCRGAFPWHLPHTWDTNLLAYYRKAVRLRAEHAVLRTGSYQTVLAVDNVFAFRRVLGEKEMLIVFNANVFEHMVTIPAVYSYDGPLQDVWDGGSWSKGTAGHTGRIAPRAAAILCPNERTV